MQTFRDQDAEYPSWRDAHRHDDFDINTEAAEGPTYIRLHRASCSTLAGHPANGAVWTHHYARCDAATMSGVASRHRS